MEKSKQRILRSFPPEWEWDNDCDIVVRVWSDEPTPEEIKACHPTCKSCKHIFIYESQDAPPFCDNDASAIQFSNVNPDTDYCNHHEPKET